MSYQKENEKFISSNVLEGMVSIRALLDGIDAKINNRRIFEIWFSESQIKKKNGELRYLKARSYDLQYELKVVSPSEIESHAIGTTHGGILAFCSDRALPSLPNTLPKDGFYVYLDGIEDPYNFGYALRSLYAAGCDGILLPSRNWTSAAGVVCRASAGASERFCMYTTELTEALALFSDHGYRVICADMEDSVSMYDADLQKPLLLVVGGEKRGISRAVLDRADQIVRIDYGREFQASLSAAGAATVLGFEVARQNRSK